MEQVETITCPWCKIFMRLNSYPEHVQVCASNPLVVLLAKVIMHSSQISFDPDLYVLSIEALAYKNVANGFIRYL